MKTRTRNPAVGIASSRVRTGEMSSVRYISTDSARYGIAEVATWSQARRGQGWAYGASVSRHAGCVDVVVIAVSGLERGSAIQVCPGCPLVDGVVGATPSSNLPRARLQL